MAPLDESELQNIESALRTQLEWLNERIQAATDGQANEKANFHSSYPHDPGEESSEEQLMDTAEALLAHWRTEASDIERALVRLSEETYGNCTRCGEAIPVARLVAMPAATRCVNCEAAH